MDTSRNGSMKELTRYLVHEDQLLTRKFLHIIALSFQGLSDDEKQKHAERILQLLKECWTEQSFLYRLETMIESDNSAPIDDYTKELLEQEEAVLKIADDYILNGCDERWALV